MKSQSLKLRERAKVGRIRQVGFVCVVSQNSKCKKSNEVGENFHIKIKKQRKQRKIETKNKQPSHRNAATHAKTQS